MLLILIFGMEYWKLTEWHMVISHITLSGVFMFLCAAV